LKQIILAILLVFTVLPANATAYFLAPASASPAGSDANNGTSAATPWLTPNHALNCGDTITAVASTGYLPANFTYGKWGVVTCAAGNNVAWLICATFDACKMSYTSGDAMSPDESYWGVQGWEVDGTTGSGGSCFIAYSAHGIPLHHIIFANDIANVCGRGGYGMPAFSTTIGSDYVVFIGDIAYGTSGSSTACDSAFDIYAPVQTDTLPGTHIYVAGNFAWDNVNANPCGGGTPTDGEGLIFDSFDGSQTGSATYNAQAVATNNIFFLNGGRGILFFQNKVSSPLAKLYAVNNTLYGNNKDTNQNSVNCAALLFSATFFSQAYGNLAITNSSTGCGANPVYALGVMFGSDSSDHVYQNFAYSASGNNTITTGSDSFVFGPNNILGTNPSLSNPVDPGAPSCGSASSVPNCMATVIANFTPTTAAAKAYGYQPVSSTSRYDPLYPAWLCTVTNLPAGLVTPGFLHGSAVSGVTVH
jgi:hypothetical protein